MKPIEAGDRKIGQGEPCFIVAEAGVNHNGNLETALMLVDIAKDAGADAVKFQTFLSDRVASPRAPKAAYQGAPDESQLDMIRKLELSFDSFRKIKAYCDEKKILFMSSPFDEESVDFLDELEVPVFKIASGELTNHPLLRHIAIKGRPVILSTGMCYLGEVEDAVRVLREAGNKQLALLHCVSNYPTDPETVNLRAMQTLERAFDVPIGFSDHTLGIEIALAAIALGAHVLEKHFTIDREMEGPDHRISMAPDQLRHLVLSVRTVEAALGHGEKIPLPSEEAIRSVVRRSLVLTIDVNEGTTIRANHLTALRPAGGIPPDRMASVNGKKTTRALKAGTVLSWEDLS